MIIRIWRGEVTLWKTFWFWGAGGGLALGLPLFAAILALTDVPDDATASGFMLALGFLFVYLAWVFVGIWRAAGRYRGDRSWARLARFAVAAETLKILIFIGAVVFTPVG